MKRFILITLKPHVIRHQMNVGSEVVSTRTDELPVVLEATTLTGAMNEADHVVAGMANTYLIVDSQAVPQARMSAYSTNWELFPGVER